MYQQVQPSMMISPAVSGKVASSSGAFQPYSREAISFEAEAEDASNDGSMEDDEPEHHGAAAEPMQAVTSPLADFMHRRSAPVATPS